ncbi:uncharacterized protein LOC119283704 [Triticum dicoccoides]|uniref:uncharacterized protein LOC119283704 n=1 Tax=Triticum dicoccoides TaxID=85692 RepID=UPI00189006CC|nr:uncharacterized protein LOC119283704 [Triticum dicoccoides]
MESLALACVDGPARDRTESMLSRCASRSPHCGALPRADAAGAGGSARREGGLSPRRADRRAQVKLLAGVSPSRPRRECLPHLIVDTQRVLLLAKGTGIHKSFIVPLFVLQAPSTVISWIKSEYGMWTAFLALAVRLFLPFPGDLELPQSTMLAVSVAPYQVMNVRYVTCSPFRKTLAILLHMSLIIHPLGQLSTKCEVAKKKGN